MKRLIDSPLSFIYFDDLKSNTFLLSNDALDRLPKSFDSDLKADAVYFLTSKSRKWCPTLCLDPLYLSPGLPRPIKIVGGES
jgi:hypothetical protein